MAHSQVGSYNLARLMVRLLSRQTCTTAGGLPLGWFENMFGYFSLGPSLAAKIC